MKTLAKNHLAHAEQEQQRAHGIACAALDAGNYKESIAKFRENLEKWPLDYRTKLNLGIALLANGDCELAARTFHELHKSDSENEKYLLYCGIAFEKIGAFKESIQFLSRHNKKNNKVYSAWMTLAAAYNKNRQYTDGLLAATQALALEPTRSDAYNNIGAALMAMNRFDDALQAFETSNILSPGNIDALSNIATVLEKKEKYGDAIEIFNELLARTDINISKKSELLYRSSFSYLATGKLQEGWRRYDFGFDPLDTASRMPKRKFSIPQWRGEDIKKSTLLVWAEQGIGDEIRFFSALKEAEAACEKLVVQCDPRLVSLLKNSFPHADIRASKMYPNPFGVEIPSDCDFHIPAGSLMGVFRNEIKNFEKGGPYIIPFQKDVDDFEFRLSKYAHNKLIGISWKSGVINAQRRKHSMYLNEMAPLLKMENTTFVNLQYGECEQEIVDVEKELGIKIVRWSDVNLKNDQEKLAAIIQNLDAVVSIGTAVGEMAAAVGANSYIFGRENWVMLGEESCPWYNNVKYIPAQPAGDVIYSILSHFKKGEKND